MSKETASQRAARLMREVDGASVGHYTKGEVKTILNSIAACGDDATEVATADEVGCRAPVKLQRLVRGDVFIAKLVGGKVRPWVVLDVSGDSVSALALSSGDTAPGMVKSKCRLWPSSWIGATISAFTVEFAAQEVTRPYTNLRHLAEVERAIAARHGMTVNRQKPEAVTSIAQIRARVSEAAA